MQEPRVRIEIDPETRRRLDGTCFRGGDVRAAGNFSRWKDLDEKGSDREYMPIFFQIIRECVADRRDNLGKWTERITVPFGKPVGWSSTIPLDKVAGVRTEMRPLNRRSRAVFVLDGMEAPLTNLVSYTIDFYVFGRNGRAFIRTMYPGPHVGQLEGDMTKKTGMAWFDFRHPGGKTLLPMEL